MYLVDRVQWIPSSIKRGGEQTDDVFGTVREVVAHAGDPAIVGDDAAAVAVNQAEDELFGGVVDERLLPGLESDRPRVLLAGAVLRKQTRPML